MDIIKAIREWIDGKKTYIVAALTGLLAGYTALHPGFVVPEWVWMFLTALGLGAVRSAIGKSQ